jgi:hypothetical protein
MNNASSVYFTNSIDFVFPFFFGAFAAFLSFFLCATAAASSFYFT